MRACVHFGQFRSGFTLIELLVVIAIVGVLAALLSTVIGKGKERARAAHCRNNLHQLAIGVRLYADDEAGRFPRIENPGGKVGTTVATNGELRRVLRGPAGSDELFKCRADRSDNWARGGSSYSWNSAWNGRLIDNLRRGDGLWEKPLLYDSQPWHGQSDGGTGTRNGAFIDGHVGEY